MTDDPMNGSQEVVDLSRLAADAHALGHPIRALILWAMPPGRTASPSELASELEEPLGDVSYHARVLIDLGLLRLIDTQPRRGAVEHYYEVARRPRLVLDPP